MCWLANCAVLPTNTPCNNMLPYMVSCLSGEITFAISVCEFLFPTKRTGSTITSTSLCIIRVQRLLMLLYNCHECHQFHIRRYNLAV